MPSCSETQEALSNAVDARLLEIVRDGVILKDKDGNVVLDAGGNPMREQPTAAHLQAAIARLRALGISKVVQPGDDADELARAVGLTADTLKFPTAHKLPPVSEEPDERTGT